MPNPQIEDGYTKIANELLEALCKIRIPGQASQIFLTILRKTYGYQKKQDCISLAQFEFATGLPKNKICEALNKLEEMNLIIITEKGNKLAKTFEINKTYKSWNPLPKKVTLPKKGIIITEKGNNHYRKRVLQKKVSKENITKENYSSIFDETFWPMWPRKVDKANAEKAFVKACKKEDPEIIIAGLKNQLDMFNKKEKQFIPHASSWLNAERWKDEIEKPRAVNSYLPKFGIEPPEDIDFETLAGGIK